MPRVRFLAAPLLAALLVAAGCYVEPPVVRGRAIDGACADPCAEPRDACVGAQAGSPFLRIPAPLLALPWAIRPAARRGHCRGRHPGSRAPCAAAAPQCLQACPLAAGPPSVGAVP